MGRGSEGKRGEEKEQTWRWAREAHTLTTLDRSRGGEGSTLPAVLIYAPEIYSISNRSIVNKT